MIENLGEIANPVEQRPANLTRAVKVRSVCHEDFLGVSRVAASGPEVGRHLCGSTPVTRAARCAVSR
ncbi:hypothetical protein GCM10010191_89360 [Actinomadura vinacea]|uniref:Uncharacterized protein n=1 Tax=Actinomadura vinacea TaxID=115336 RepID=A0ABN3KD26_9ACTN